jgi:hypothetical protein
LAHHLGVGASGACALGNWLGAGVSGACALVIGIASVHPRLVRS